MPKLPDASPLLLFFHFISEKYDKLILLKSVVDILYHLNLTAWSNFTSINSLFKYSLAAGQSKGRSCEMIEPCLDHSVIHRATVSLFVSVAYDLRHVVAHQFFIVSWLQRIKILDTSRSPRTGEALRLQVSKLNDLGSWNRCCRCGVFIISRRKSQCCGQLWEMVQCQCGV